MRFERRLRKSLRLNGRLYEAGVVNETRVAWNYRQVSGTLLFGTLSPYRHDAN